jgi:hypothetical protein
MEQPRARSTSPRWRCSQSIPAYAKATCAACMALGSGSSRDWQEWSCSRPRHSRLNAHVAILNDVAWSIVETQRGKQPIRVFPRRGKAVATMNNTAWQRARREANRIYSGCGLLVEDIKTTQSIMTALRRKLKDGVAEQLTGPFRGREIEICASRRVAMPLYASAFAAAPLRAICCVSRITVRAASVSSP